jgi:hypothetical protein
MQVIADFYSDSDQVKQLAAEEEERRKAEATKFFKFDPNWTWDQHMMRVD